jgi:hypothetical protein
MVTDTLSSVLSALSAPAASPQADAFQQNASGSGRAAKVQDRVPAAGAYDRVEASNVPSQPQTSVTYFVDQETKQLYFKVIDEQSGKVVRQFPPQEVLNSERHIAEVMAQAEARTSGAKHSTS